MGTLYVVGTPIGNLQDITFRALRVLGEAGVIAAEDTRKTMKLLSYYDIHTPMVSYHRHSGPERRGQIIAALREKDVALVSEAGMPGISDPGQDLIAAAIAAGFPVVPVPGPSAALSALVVSGLPAGTFLYLGFLPRVRSDRRKLLAGVAAAPHTLVIFEAPHRLRATLADLEEILGDRPAAAARELTKIHEETVRATISGLRATFEERSPRGEFTLVIGPPEAAPPVAAAPSPSAAFLARQLRAEGAHGKEAVRHIMSQTGVGRRDAYQAWLGSAGSLEGAPEHAEK
jgi:16S rRNA (cytidine1402-2'-O)-methyltransferase